MVSLIVEELRKLDVHPETVTEVSGPNRHERRKTAAEARQYRHLAKRPARNAKAKRRAAQKRAKASRRANRKAK